MVKNEIGRLKMKRKNIENEALVNSKYRNCTIKGPSNKRYIEKVLRDLKILETIVYVFEATV